MDFLSYLTVLILFKTKYSEKNETKALIVLGVLFLISAALVEFDSIWGLFEKKKPSFSLTYIIICFIQGAIFLLISIYKFVLAKKA